MVYVELEDGADFSSKWAVQEDPYLVTMRPMSSPWRCP